MQNDTNHCTVSFLLQYMYLESQIMDYFGKTRAECWKAKTSIAIFEVTDEVRRKTIYWV